MYVCFLYKLHNFYYFIFFENIGLSWFDKFFIYCRFSNSSHLRIFQRIFNVLEVTENLSRGEDKVSIGIVEFYVFIFGRNL